MRIGILLVFSVLLGLGYSIDIPQVCQELQGQNVDLDTLEFDQEDRSGNIQRFCLQRAIDIRREHFWCRGYIDSDMKFMPNTSLADFPTEANQFWTIFLQYPALSWMDVARKRSIMEIIQELVSDQDECRTGIGKFEDFCISNVETYDVAEYSESVLVTIYNFGSNGLDGDTFNRCFGRGLSSGSNYVTRFRGKLAFRLSLNVSLEDMFNQNIGPASSIGNEDRDPTLRPVILGSWGSNVTLEEAKDRTSDGRFATNPDPINYGLEAGDIVFAVFGSILLLVVAILVVLGFFIHPFFLS